MLRIGKRVAVAGTFAAFALSGCYVVPVAPDGTPIGAPTVAAPVVPVPAVPVPAPAPPQRVVVPSEPPLATMHARLYPANDLASKSGMLTGTVTNYMDGSGRFQLDYQGELMQGEATRVVGNARRGVANAYGPRGTYMNCEYEMRTPVQGTGHCLMSNGARYEVHIGG
jgi:hypothetical protein